ncbi:hypothetical protein MRX96_018855 [Rhipicephalus microplus]|uniref:Uncharacterized protein n=1 Tax=Rhipicephalus microplus TaxID=6941 RepID=A0A9J6EY05_RHIMP|nr:hypothetical protein HPB51_004978 [Rhipicephalus microplus]
MAAHYVGVFQRVKKTSGVVKLCFATSGRDFPRGQGGCPAKAALSPEGQCPALRRHESSQRPLRLAAPARSVAEVAVCCLRRAVSLLTRICAIAPRVRNSWLSPRDQNNAVCLAPSKTVFVSAQIAWIRRIAQRPLMDLHSDEWLVSKSYSLGEPSDLCLRDGSKCHQHGALCLALLLTFVSRVRTASSVDVAIEWPSSKAVQSPGVPE